jgi:hypothetical protein
MTVGEINREIAIHGIGRLSAFRYPSGSTHTERFYRQFPSSNKPNKDVYGNWSKYAKNWVAGPNHEVVKQHVPGYTGHVPGVFSENLFAKSYARCTSTAIGKQHPKGYDVTPKVRYMSQTK